MSSSMKRMSLISWKNKGAVYSKNISLYIKCKNCGSIEDRSVGKVSYKIKKGINKLEVEDKDNYCISCWKGRDKNGRMLPKDARLFAKSNGFVTLEIFKKYSENFNTKIKVKCTCENCDLEFFKGWGKLRHSLKSEHIPGKIYCPKCINKKIYETETWRRKNSESQFIAQNRKETKRKNSEGVKRAHESDPTIRQRISIAAKKMWKNPEIAQRIQVNSSRKYLSGYFKSVYFASSYELMFLLWCEENTIRYERCRFIIEYIDDGGRKRDHFPDFFLNKNKVVEVKGNGSKNSLLKKEASEKFFKEKKIEYEMLFLEDLIQIGCTKINSVYDLIKLRKKYEREIKINIIPKTWKSRFVGDCRKKRKFIQRKSV